MRHKAINADRLFEAFRDSLRWEWLAGLGASERRFDEMAVRSARSGADLVGYLNYIHPYRLQVLGEREVAYLTNATDRRLRPPHCPHRQRWSRRSWCWQTGSCAPSTAGHV